MSTAAAWNFIKATTFFAKLAEVRTFFLETIDCNYADRMLDHLEAFFAKMRTDDFDNSARFPDDGIHVNLAYGAISAILRKTEGSFDGWKACEKDGNAEEMDKFEMELWEGIYKLYSLPKETNKCNIFLTREKWCVCFNEIFSGSFRVHAFVNGR